MSSSAWIGSYWPWAALLRPSESCSRAVEAVEDRAEGERRLGAVVAHRAGAVGDRQEGEDHARAVAAGLGSPLRAPRPGQAAASSSGRGEHATSAGTRAAYGSRAGIATILTAGGDGPTQAGRRNAASAQPWPNATSSSTRS